MAASDYNGKEKASLNNIKEMIENGASLQQIRGAMGLGYSLDVLAAANGGTGVATLQDVADVIAEALSGMKGSDYSGVGASLLISGSSGKTSFNYVQMKPSATASSGNGVSISSNAIRIGKAGIYRIEFRGSHGANVSLDTAVFVKGVPFAYGSGGLCRSDVYMAANTTVDFRVYNGESESYAVDGYVSVLLVS